MWIQVEEWRPDIFSWGTPVIPYLDCLGGGVRRPVHPGAKNHMLGSRGKRTSVWPVFFTATERLCLCISTSQWGGLEGTILPSRGPGTFHNVWRLFSCSIWGKGCYWHLVVEARAAARDPTIRSTAPTTKVYPARNDSSAHTDKPCRVTHCIFQSTCWGAIVSMCLGIW